MTKLKPVLRYSGKILIWKFREGHLSTIGDNLSNNTSVGTGAKNGYIVLDDPIPGFLTTTVPTSSTVVLKNAVPLMKNRTNGYPRWFRDFRNSQDKFVFCRNLCIGDELWSAFMIIFHSFLLVGFIMAFKKCLGFPITWLAITYFI